jgi:hypothetical protein
MTLTRDELVARLIRAGELEVSGEDQVETDSYFDSTQFRFHGPDGFEADYSGLTNYFKAIRAAFDDRSIRRGVIVGVSRTRETGYGGTERPRDTPVPARSDHSIDQGSGGGLQAWSETVTG